MDRISRRMNWPRLTAWLPAVALLLGPALATAELKLPPGFTAHVYVTGEGFESGGMSGAGIPSASTLAFDGAGVLYMGRTGYRYSGAEVEDLFPIYRVPVGGARLRPTVERQYLYGPPLPNPQVATVRAGRDVFLSTFDRDRKIGVLYHLRDGRTELVAGGTPERGGPPLLRQPEGAAADVAGNLYVADREQGRIVKLDPTGRVLDPRYVMLTRPRVLAVDDANELWVGADGEATAPWQRGPGEIWKVGADGVPRLMLRGPVPAAIGMGPGRHLFVADRHNARVFALAADGRRVDFAVFADGDAPRSLTFAPVTPETRRAGFAGDLFIVTIRRGSWRLNEVVRITGPFEEFLGQPPSSR